ncbi:hypothetical protein BJX66DRAFT_295809 [Aspergillus keveii]|uniref:Uncharacterized protein n=1 Tax=Aspergillus keveii TaxID=714993 RepID=A0ABR4GGS1_9EURO
MYSARSSVGFSLYVGRTISLIRTFHPHIASDFAPQKCAHVSCPKFTSRLLCLSVISLRDSVSAAVIPPAWTCSWVRNSIIRRPLGMPNKSDTTRFKRRYGGVQGRWRRSHAKDQLCELRAVRLSSGRESIFAPRSSNICNPATGFQGLESQ